MNEEGNDLDEELHMEQKFSHLEDLQYIFLTSEKSKGSTSIVSMYTCFVSNVKY